MEAGVAGAAVPRRFEDLVIVRKMKNRELFWTYDSKSSLFFVGFSRFRANERTTKKHPICRWKKKLQPLDAKLPFR